MHGLDPSFRCHPLPPLGDGADDGLTAVVDVDVLHRHLLLTLTTVAVQRLHLGRKGPRQLIERLLCRLGLVRAAGRREAVGEGHYRHVDRRHLRRNLNVELAEFDAFVGTAVFPNLGEWEGDGFCTIGSCHLVHSILVFLCDA